MHCFDESCPACKEIKEDAENFRRMKREFKTKMDWEKRQQTENQRVREARGEFSIFDANQ